MAIATIRLSVEIKNSQLFEKIVKSDRLFSSNKTNAAAMRLNLIL